MLPNFLIIGAMKAATTSIAVHLNEHPDIFIPDEKELHFFVKEVNWSKGIEWYQSFFNGRQEKYLAESSTMYTWYPSYKGIPERIKEILPEVKLIYICRHPIERAFSDYMRCYLLRTETRSINCAITTDSAYITRSLYYLQLEEYLKYFDKKNILILCFDEICNDVSTVLLKIYNFLDVKENFISDKIMKQFNVTSKNPFCPDYFIRLRQYIPFYNSVVSILPLGFKKALMSLMTREYRGNKALTDLDKKNYHCIVPVVKEDILKFDKYIANSVPCLKRFLAEVGMS